MNAEQRLEQDRSHIVKAIEWIDVERKRLSRHCFSETRKKWHGEKARGKEITLMKKESEWLYGRRCRLRQRISVVNVALKEARRARSGTVTESFGSLFVDVARERLPQEVFNAIVDDATSRHGGEEAVSSDAPQAATETALEELKKELAAFKQSNEAPVAQVHGGPVAQVHKRKTRETQADFGVADITDNSRILAAPMR